MASFTSSERKALARALAAGERLECPACGGEVSRREVEPSRQVSYVRRRVLLICPACGRGGAIDLGDPGPA